MNLGERMKENYEFPSRIKLTKRTPIIIRVDGRAFHSYTKKFDRPFDLNLISTMVESVIKTATEMSGFKLCYIQSDEASFLLTDYDNLETQGWFNYVKSKIETITASLMTANFNELIKIYNKTNKLAVFDARAFNIPKEEICNYFLWRCQDWERNSLTMYCSKFFSHKQLHKKNKEEQHEMLYSVNKNWTIDLSNQIKNGTFVINDNGNFLIKTDIIPNYEIIRQNIENLFN